MEMTQEKSISGFVFSAEGSVKESATLGESLHEQYSASPPFPHICIDNFLDRRILDSVLEDFGSIPAPPEDSYDRAQERLKFSYNPDTLPSFTRNLFHDFNARPFIAFLEKLTGISGLIPDPYYLGGGIHQVRNGGHLDIHADFNYHPMLKLERRINVLIYLNEGWMPEFGGQFEIWDTEMTQRIKSFDPVFNRCVIFNTTSDSYHGNPIPVAHPHGKSRLSIALYYYTATWDGTKRTHTTQFKVRPNSRDRFDWKVRTKEILHEVTPPFMVRYARQALNGLKK